MEAENLPAVRDLFYLTALLMGVFAGSLFAAFGRDTTIRRRNRLITFSLCIASAVILSLAGMLIVSGGRILWVRPFLIPGGIGIIMTALAFRFPRAAAFPLFLGCGLFIVWLGYGFLRFPPVGSPGTPLASIHRGPDGTLSIRFAYRTEFNDELKVLTLEDTGGAPEFSAARIHFDERYPLIGGEDRGLITGIRGTRDYYTYTPPTAQKPFPGISFRSVHSGPEPLPFERNLLVLFDGETLTFRPSWHIPE
jgi:hypothetical protein